MTRRDGAVRVLVAVDPRRGHSGAVKERRGSRRGSARRSGRARRRCAAPGRRGRGRDEGDEPVDQLDEGWCWPSRCRRRVVGHRPGQLDRRVNGRARHRVDALVHLETRRSTGAVTSCQNRARGPTGPSRPSAGETPGERGHPVQRAWRSPRASAPSLSSGTPGTRSFSAWSIGQCSQRRRTGPRDDEARLVEHRPPVAADLRVTALETRNAFSVEGARGGGRAPRSRPFGPRPLAAASATTHLVYRRDALVALLPARAAQRQGRESAPTRRRRGSRSSPSSGRPPRPPRPAWCPLPVASDRAQSVAPRCRMKS